MVENGGRMDHRWQASETGCYCRLAELLTRLNMRVSECVSVCLWTACTVLLTALAFTLSSKKHRGLKRRMAAFTHPLAGNKCRRSNKCSQCTADCPHESAREALGRCCPATIPREVLPTVTAATIDSSQETWSSRKKEETERKCSKTMVWVTMSPVMLCTMCDHVALVSLWSLWEDHQDHSVGASSSSFESPLLIT